MNACTGRGMLAAATLFTALAALPAWAECRIVAAQGARPGAPVPMVMFVAVNTPCLQKVSPHAEGRIESARITRRPRHGRAGLANNHDFAYTPATDFFGQDSFEVTLTANAGGQRRAGRFHFEVRMVR